MVVNLTPGAKAQQRLVKNGQNKKVPKGDPEGRQRGALPRQRKSITTRG